jgi:hypothetical protein
MRDDLVAWWEEALRSTPRALNFIVDYAHGMVDLEAPKRGCF